MKKQQHSTLFIVASTIIVVGTGVFVAGMIGFAAYFIATGEAFQGKKITSTFDIQGHRGCRGLMPENTIQGFKMAMDIGVNTLEMDVVISKDKKVVLSHDPFLGHYICHGPNGQNITEENETQFNLYEMEYSEIKKCDCGSKFHPKFPNQKKFVVNKPLLEEVIDTVERYAVEINRQLPLLYNIEIKSKPSGDNKFHPAPQEFAELVYSLLNEKGVLNRTTIQSFDVRALQAMRAINPSVKLALLVEFSETELPKTAENIANFNFEDKLNRLGFIPDIYSPEYTLIRPELINYVSKNDMQLIPWTINAEEDIKKYSLMPGVDGIITDYPDRAVHLRHDV